MIKAFGLLDMIDTRLMPDAPEVSAPGEAVAGMILNGLGVTHRPLSWKPKCCASTPLDRWCREGIEAKRCNRFTLGRTLDEAQAYGCDLWFLALAREICVHTGLDLRVHHLDTTSVSLNGEGIPERAEPAITITHGSSRDHRPGVKPAVLELMVSHDGGIPLVSKSWAGKTADREMFQARTQALMTAFQHAPSPRSLIADAKLDHVDQCPQPPHPRLDHGLPNTIGPVSQVSTPALTGETWSPLDATTRSQRLELCPDGLAQRWLVVPSQGASPKLPCGASPAPWGRCMRSSGP